jgi:hypothetical protein
MNSGPFLEKANEKIKPPKGIYETRVVDLDIIADVRCGEHIADIYKVHYRIEEGDFKDFTVKDNGVFRYKEKDGFAYDPKRNWGYGKFYDLLGLPKNTKDKLDIPALDKHTIDGYIVKIDLAYKTFVNEAQLQVSYPVAKLVEKVSEVPF